MDSEDKNGTVDQISNKYDNKKSRFHIDLDGAITKYFPYFLVCCIVLSIIHLIRGGDYTVLGILHSITFAFTVCFTIGGFLMVFFMKRGCYSFVQIGPVIILLPLMISTVLYYTLGKNELIDFIYDNFTLFPEVQSFGNLTFAMYALFGIVFFVAVGVVTVTVAYLRINLPKIFFFIDRHSDEDSRKKRIAHKFFLIPDIIDVKSVELEPVNLHSKEYNRELFVSVFTGIFIIGVTMCSYIFVNPIFLQQIPFEDMLMITIMLSLFMSPLVIPWVISKYLGAIVISSARPYIMWKGLKARMFQGFFAILFIMTMVTMMAYFGADLSRVLYTYLGYVIFMFLISVFTSFIFVNYFANSFRDDVYTTFYKKKGD